MQTVQRFLKEKVKIKIINFAFRRIFLELHENFAKQGL